VFSRQVFSRIAVHLLADRACEPRVSEVALRQPGAVPMVAHQYGYGWPGSDTLRKRQT
jgi:hypothetical protein